MNLQLWQRSASYPSLSQLRIRKRQILNPGIFNPIDHIQNGCNVLGLYTFIGSGDACDAINFTISSISSLIAISNPAPGLTGSLLLKCSAAKSDSTIMAMRSLNWALGSQMSFFLALLESPISMFTSVGRSGAYSPLD